MVLAMHDEDDEPICDNKTMGLAIQQFLDEWHFRILHANIAVSWDREDTARVALDIIEMNGGFEITDEEKDEWILLDEDKMVENIVMRMTEEGKVQFEHFALQIQLVVSTVCRVRHCVEDCKETKEEFLEIEDEKVEAKARAEATFKAACQEAGRALDVTDSGISEQVLKVCILEAAAEIAELQSLRKSWMGSTEKRLDRLLKCNDEAIHARQELAAVRTQLGSFGGEQSAKSKAALVNVANKADGQLLHMVYSAWYGTFLKYKAEKDIHDKFRKQIADAEDKLIQYRQRQLASVKGVLQRKAAEQDGGIMDDVIRLWRKAILDEKGDAAMQESMKATQAKIAAMESSSLENNKKVMMRMTAGNDTTLMELIWQSWNNWLEDYKKNKDLEDAVKKAEKQLAEFTAKKSAEAKGVLDRMSGASASGLIMNSFNAWRDLQAELNESRKMEQMMEENASKMANLQGRQKGAAKGVSARANELESEIFIQHIFLSWVCEAGMGKVVKFYKGQLDQKTGQLDAVQTMFKSFAVQLEQGMANVEDGPRSQRSRSTRGPSSTRQNTDRAGSTRQPAADRPPALPAA